AHGARVVGVVLSGMLGDGAHGLAYIKARGGAALVQAPHDALHPGMPEAAIAQVAVDAVLPMDALGPAVVREARARAALPPEAPMTDPTRDEVELDGVGTTDGGVSINQALGGELAPFTCPECQGPLWEIRDGLPVRFRCRVGHSYDAPTLVHDKDAALEGALWTAITALEENASLARQMAERAESWGRPIVTERFLARAEMLAARARTVRAAVAALADAGVSLAADGVPLAAVHEP
ncbi:MAG TPA: chemotaxis protein CheB, partial [Gemmatirosa sp.]|nr:chemotaxis protein CheB [Gemmatirosa sp.]